MIFARRMVQVRRKPATMHADDLAKPHLHLAHKVLHIQRCARMVFVVAVAWWAAEKRIVMNKILSSSNRRATHTAKTMGCAASKK